MRISTIGLVALIASYQTSGSQMVSINENNIIVCEEIHNSVMEESDNRKIIQRGSYIYELEANEDENRKHLKIILRENKKNEEAILCFCYGHSGEFRSKPDLYLSSKKDPMTGERFLAERPVTRARKKECDEIINIIHKMIYEE